METVFCLIIFGSVWTAILLNKIKLLKEENIKLSHHKLDSDFAARLAIDVAEFYKGQKK